MGLGFLPLPHPNLVETIYLNKDKMLRLITMARILQPSSGFVIAPVEMTFIHKMMNLKIGHLPIMYPFSLIFSLLEFLARSQKKHDLFNCYILLNLWIIF